MVQKNTVTINGVAYDAHTGMRISMPTPQKQPAPKTINAAQSIHSQAQRTKTLSKRNTKQGKRTSLLTAPVKQPVKSPRITRFATTAPSSKKVISDIGPQQHTSQVKHRAAVSKQKPASVPPASVVKAKAITDAVAKSSKKKHIKKSFFKRHPRVFTISAVLLVILIVGGYITYINLPSLSVRLASAQAGISAAYPSYQPSGFALDGSVSYDKDEVTLNFKATAGPQRFTLKQTKSNWDSSALLENFVIMQNEGKYDTYIDSGLTIYVFGTNAAWVNGGILHTITGDAPLTNEQLRRIALSM